MEYHPVHPRILIIGFIAILFSFSIHPAMAADNDAPKYEGYVVSENQTIETIAAEYGISPQVLSQFNNLRVTDALSVGSIILVPLDVELAPVNNTNGTGNNPVSTNANATAANNPQTPGPNQIAVTYATVSAKRVEVRSQPNGGGNVLWNKLVQGKEVYVVQETGTYYGILMSDGTIGWVPRLALWVSNSHLIIDKSWGDPNGRADLVDTAFKYLGIPYRLGGKLPDSVDCSLLVQTVFAQHGFSLPRTAAGQFQIGMPVDSTQLQLGDRLYFSDRAHSKIGHTAIYIGNGNFIHASSNRGKVAIDKLSNSTYASIYAGARR